MRITEILSEARVEIWGNMVSVLKNPSPMSALFFIGNTRQGVARLSILNDTLYMWDAALANHADVRAIYAPDDTNEFSYTMAERADEEYAFAGQPNVLPAAMAHRYIAAILAQPNVELVHDGSVQDRY